MKPDKAGDGGDRLLVYISGTYGTAVAQLQYLNG